jgi:hypothetical protein
VIVQDLAREVMALSECDQLLSEIMGHLTEGSILFVGLAQVRIRVLWLLRNNNQSRSQSIHLEISERYLRRFLSQPPPPVPELQ